MQINVSWWPLPLIGFLAFACGGNEGEDEVGGLTSASESDGTGESTGDGDGNTTSDEDGNTTGDVETDEGVDTTEGMDADDMDVDTTNDTTGGCGPGEMLCEGVCTDVLSDGENCGACGNACWILDTQFGTFGGCENGDCAPSLSECIPFSNPAKTCNQVCSEFGMVCAEDQCDGGTLSSWGFLDSCEDFDGGAATTLNCDDPAIGAYYRCCCDDA
jgi:hypothetical protein